MDQVTTLPIAPFWLALIVLAFAIALVAAYLPDSARKSPAALDRFRTRIGYGAMDGGLFLLLAIFAILAAALWAAVVGILLHGLIGLILDIRWSELPLRSDTSDAAKDALWAWRFKLAQIAGLTTLLGAVIALPITLNRLRLTRIQTDTAQESLFNEKITEASEGLHARRQVTRRLEPKNVRDEWQDDIVRRNAAIDRLEGLVMERPEPEIAARVARLLSVYMRELSQENPPRPAPESQDEETQRAWLAKLPAPRSDMQNAVQVIGRLTRHVGATENTLPIDLRGANLQGVELSRQGKDAPLDFRNARLEAAQLQGAVLWEAQLQGADLGRAQLQGARLGMAQLQGANLGRAQLQGAVLWEAHLQGAVLWEAQLQGANLGRAQLQGADLRGAQLQGADLWEAQLHGANLGMAQLQGANLGMAQLQGANLGRAQLQGADLGEAQLQGADLVGAQLDDSTNLVDASLRGASTRLVDDTTIAKFQPFWQDIFADGSVQLPDDEPRPDHWANETLDFEDFLTRWRAWQRSIGQDPDNPA